ncbi:MAG: nucleotidyltransferase family protein [Clostridia bacterium]|nr:nucleotidyltransferase family protein [Clostridia bacterium]
MICVGTVAEFNPFHLGHQVLIDQMRKRAGKEGIVICVMSGHATQRALFPVTDKYTRAEMALRSGTDLVLELPFPQCASNARAFALAGVRILCSMKTDLMLFGSECGDPDLLSRVTDMTENEKTVRTEDDENLGDPALFARSVQALGIPELGPNDRLGIAYMRAAKDDGLELSFDTVLRPAVSDLAPSASDLRKRILAGDDSFQALLPEVVLDIWNRAEAEGRVLSPDHLQRLHDYVWMTYRSPDTGRLDTYGMCGGLNHRIFKKANEAPDSDAFFTSLKTKRYTDAHLRRVLLFGLTGVSREDTEKKPRYTILLGASKAGKTYLSSLRKAELDIPVVTKPSDVPDSEAAGRQKHLSEELDKLFTTCLVKALPSGRFIRESPVLPDNRQP